MRKVLRITDPEPTVVTVIKEVPAEIPDRFTKECENEELLPYGSTLAELLSHAGDQTDNLNSCSDQVDEIRALKERSK